MLKLFNCVQKKVSGLFKNVFYSGKEEIHSEIELTIY